MRDGAGPYIFELPEAGLVAGRRQPPAPSLINVAEAVSRALEKPLGAPALRRALTPDDHVAVVIDDSLPDLPRFVVPLLEHLALARVPAGAVKFLCTDSAANCEWFQHLPEPLRGAQLEIHDPHDRKKLSYLATTKQGRRVYLNRAAVDADQLVVLSRRCYDPVLGIGGAEGAIYPALSDAETQRSASNDLSMDVPGEEHWPIKKEAAEVVWLLGAPFFVQVIEGVGNDVSHVLGGFADTSSEGQRLQNARWQISIDEVPDLVIAQLSGPPSIPNFVNMANALACASRVVKHNGAIVLVSGGGLSLGPAAQLIRKADTPEDALQLLMAEQPADLYAGFYWAKAAQHAKLFVLSQAPGHIVEELFATSLEDCRQVEEFARNQRWLLLEDADKTMAVGPSSARLNTGIVKTESPSKTSV